MPPTAVGWCSLPSSIDATDGRTASLNGSLIIKAQLPAAASALFLQALEATLPEVPWPLENCEFPLHVTAEASVSRQ